MTQGTAGHSGAGTRSALLDAGEALFAKRGVDAVSVREITKAARANLGAINYHFRSKEQLVMEVFARRLQQVNRQRLAKLDALEAGAKAPALEDVLDALLRPMVEDETSTRGRTDEFMRLICRSFQEPAEELRAFFAANFGEIVRRFDAAMLRAVPGLSKEELFWRGHFLFGAIHHGLELWVGFDAMPLPPGLNRRKLRPDRDGLIQRLVSFAAAGIRAAAQSSKVK